MTGSSLDEIEMSVGKSSPICASIDTTDIAMFPGLPHISFFDNNTMEVEEQ